MKWKLKIAQTVNLPVLFCPTGSPLFVQSTGALPNVYCAIRNVMDVAVYVPGSLVEQLPVRQVLLGHHRVLGVIRLGG